MDERDQEPVNEDQPVVGANGNGALPQLGLQSRLVSFVPKRTYFGDKFGDHLDRQPCDPPVADIPAQDPFPTTQTFSGNTIQRHIIQEHLALRAPKTEAAVLGIRGQQLFQPHPRPFQNTPALYVKLKIRDRGVTLQSNKHPTNHRNAGLDFP
ncbi:hypothetical protein AB0C86_12690 [Streptomyces lavendulae]|uniref:hypothetical protein n=1 Tax=Streptomyces lavendulae TaxID=1914 RepID=UPI0033EAFE91